MRKQTVLIAGMVLSLAFAPGAYAKGPKSGGHGGGKEKSPGMPHGFGQGKKQGWNGETAPPGWSKGEKKGWDGAGAPPGLAKKSGGEEADGDTAAGTGEEK